MKIDFYKYQGTGNDFILLDNREKKYSLTSTQIEKLCDRRFGIGADGLILLEMPHPQPFSKGEGSDDSSVDFIMIYFNADGNESSMCGNGGRCIAAFAKTLGVTKDKASFTAIDGKHESSIQQNSPMVVKLKIGDVENAEVNSDFVFLDTGSPHYVKFVDDVLSIDVSGEGKEIRNSERFKEKGTNVNFVQTTNVGLIVRSYERGVEDETLSCGTGVTASALAAVVKGYIKSDAGSCNIKSMGGNLKVYFEKTEKGFKNIWLEGEATFVYKGEIEI